MTTAVMTKLYENVRGTWHIYVTDTFYANVFMSFLFFRFAFSGLFYSFLHKAMLNGLIYSSLQG